MLQGFLITWQRGGWVGVDLFFVLSGFLIAGLLFREFNTRGELRVGRFLIRRGLKLYPAFYALFFFTLIMGRWPLDTQRLLGELLYLQNYVGAVWNHTWSLAVEEHFYLFLAALLVLLLRVPEGDGRRRPLDQIPAVAGVVLLMCLGLRIATHYFGGRYTHMTHLFPTHLRMDSLMFGVLLSYWHHYRPELLRTVFDRVAPRLVFTVGVLLLVPPFVLPLGSHPFVHTFGLTTNYLGSGAILMAGMAWEEREPRQTGLLAYVGYHSYSIYLWHMPVYWWGLTFLERYVGLSRGDPVTLAIYIMGSCAVGIAMAKIVEMPVLHIRDRFFPSRSGALETGRAYHDSAPLTYEGSAVPVATRLPVLPPA